MENMSQAPYLLPDARDGMRMGHKQVIDSMVKDGLWDVYNDFHGQRRRDLRAGPRRQPRGPGRLRHRQLPAAMAALGRLAPSTRRSSRCRCPSARATR
ncbi:MAG: hypothetical protein R3F43_19335 [bacterium]